MTSQYSCVYGMSSATPGIEEGKAHRTSGKGFSFLITVGKEGRIYWFLVARMVKTYRIPNIPRYSAADLESHVKLYLSKNVAAGIQFKSIYDNKLSCHYTALEEATYEHWTWNQFACLGDSIHKVTAHCQSYFNLLLIEI